MMAMRPVTGRTRRQQQMAARVEIKQIKRQTRKKKKRKGMWGCCVPTFAYMGVICLMWLPKIFLTVGIAFTISGMILMILGSQEHLRYETGKTSGAVLLGIGIVFIVVSSIGLYLKKLMRAIPDPETGEDRFEIRFNNDKKDIYQVEDDYRRPQSALSHTLPTATRPATAPNGGARPKTTAHNGHAPTVNGRAAGNVNMSNGRPGSSLNRSSNERSGSLSALSTNRPNSARSYASDSPELDRPRTSSGKPNSSRSGASSSSVSPRNPKAMPKTTRSAIEDDIDDEFSTSKGRPFVTRSSASLNSSLGSSGGIKAQVEIHSPPAINIISDHSFSNKGFEDDGDAVSIHPMATLEPEEQEARARSCPPSPMFTPRHMQKEVVVAELSDDD